MSKLKAGAREAMQRSIAGQDPVLEAGREGERYRVSADMEPHQPAPLGMLLQTLAGMRAAGKLLHPCEWAAYEQATQSKRLVPTLPERDLGVKLQPRAKEQSLGVLGRKTSAM